jgi:hypothetical protein
MKRTFFAAVVAAVTASTQIWLAGPETATAATAATARPRPPAAPSATLRVVPKWTYQDGGKIAVIAACSQRADLRVVTSKMLPSPVTLSKGGNLLIKLTHKTHPGKYSIMLFCMGKNKQIDSVAMKSVKILKVLSGFRQPPQPALPKHFKPNVTVSSGPPAPAKHRKK